MKFTEDVAVSGWSALNFRVKGKFCLVRKTSLLSTLKNMEGEKSVTRRPTVCVFAEGSQLEGQTHCLPSI